MIPRTMAEAQIPHRVDAVKFVEQIQKLSGEIDSSELTRLNQSVERCLAPINCVLSFERDEERHRLLVGECSTRVAMICQRCLDVVEVEVSSRFELGLVFNDDQARQLPRRLEPVELGENGQLDLWAAIEDEVLLSLPAFPAHPESECQLQQPEPEDSNSNEQQPNPFDVLAQLKQK
ncbi:MAG: hypothetical protein CMI09_14640 [Oceanospirillaceae bacterium]|nr:hypothetical protein [Oceanospirillaceae bacterium]